MPQLCNNDVNNNVNNEVLLAHVTTAFTYWPLVLALLRLNEQNQLPQLLNAIAQMLLALEPLTLNGFAIMTFRGSQGAGQPPCSQADGVLHGINGAALPPGIRAHYSSAPNNSP